MDCDGNLEDVDCEGNSGEYENEYEFDELSEQCTCECAYYDYCVCDCNCEYCYIEIEALTEFVVTNLAVLLHVFNNLMTTDGPYREVVRINN